MMLIVEAVAAESVAEKAGIHVGDRLFSYDGKTLSSPASLLALEENTFGVESVILQGQRDECPIPWEIPTGKLGVEVRPELSADVLEEYDRGRKAFETQQYAQAAQRWIQAAARTYDKPVHAWLWCKAGEAWEQEADWSQALAAYEHAWEGQQGAEEDSASPSQIATSLGRCYQNHSEWKAAVEWYACAEAVDEQAGREVWIARSLNSLGNVAEGRGDLQAAEDYNTRSLKIEERLAPHSLEVAISLTGLGIVAWRRDNLQSAEDCLTRSLQITERLAPNSLELANNLNGLGNVARLQGNLQTAEDYHIQALKIRERLTPHSLQVSASLNNLGLVAWQRGNLQTAEDYLIRALQIRLHLAPNSLGVAASLSNLGLVAHLRGDLQAADDYNTRSLKIEERLAPNSLGVATSLNNLGLAAWHQGDLQAAEDYLTRALQIQERLAPHSLQVAAGLNNLGLVVWQRGDLQAAEDYYTRSLKIKEHLAPHSLGVAMSLNNLGNVLEDRGDLATAEDYHTLAMQIQEHLAPHSLELANSLTNLGLIAWQRGNLQAAEGYHIRALQIRERLAPHSLDVSASLNNLGIVAHDRGDLQAAEDYHTRALQIRLHLAPHSLGLASSFNNLGNVAYDRGDLQTTEDYLTRALKIREHLAPHSLLCATTLTKLGKTFLRQHQPHQALPLLLHSLDILEQQRSAITSPEARALLLAQHTEKYAALTQGYCVLDRPAEAFATLERSRARSLLELLTERRLNFTSQAPDHLLHQQQDLDQQRAHVYDQLAKLSASAEEETHTETLHQQLRDLQRQQQQLTTAIQQVSPHYASLQYPQPLDLKAAQQALDPGTLLLSYLVDEEQTFLFAVTKPALQVFSLPTGRKRLAEQVQQFRAVLDLTSLEGSLRQAIEQGKGLYDLLLAPAEAQMRRAKRLLLCPDGPLHTLPWPALVTKAGRRPSYLGLQKPLHTTLSMTIYAQTREEGRDKREEKQTTAQPTDTSTSIGLTSQLLSTARSLLALGDPVYSPGVIPAFARSGSASQRIQRHPVEANQATADTSLREPDHTPRYKENPELVALCTRGLSLAPLPYSREEVESIGHLFAEQAIIRLGAEATKTAALTESGEVDLLHFACHGWLDGRDPLSSGLVFSQPEALGKAAVEGDNGLLQAWEIFSKLRLKADLVVLSACQSGLGQEVRGEGLIGLTRAFQYAGAQSVLVSLWEVSDASTSVFMRAFYEQLKEGKGKAEALQAAIQQLSSHPKWRHPFFWSAFMLHGEGD